MMEINELKVQAKINIKGHIGIWFVTMLLYTAVLSVAEFIPYVGFIITALLVPIFTLGIDCMLLDEAKGNDIAIGDLFGQFNQWWSAYKVMFLTGLFTFLWSLLLVIPGIIKGYAYSMAMYILAENPEIGAREALRRSQEMMDGHKLELFCLHLSFIGWHLLAIITFGIAYVWVMPYINATVTNFYNDIKN